MNWDTIPLLESFNYITKDTALTIIRESCLLHLRFLCRFLENIKSYELGTVSFFKSFNYIMKDIALMINRESCLFHLRFTCWLSKNLKSYKLGHYSIFGKFQLYYKRYCYVSYHIILLIILFQFSPNLIF